MHSLFNREEELWDQGYNHVLGLDEVGIGSAVGSIMVAGVIWSTNMHSSELPKKLTDSKKLTPKQRNILYDQIYENAAAVLTWEGHQQQIEDTNVLLTQLHCMKQIIENISPVPDYVLVDGLHAPTTSINIETMVKGDSKSASIAAASIVAKVTRDRQMVDLEQNYPELALYQIGNNKGYLSAEHRKALDEHGRSAFHRKTYKYKWQQTM